MFVSGILSFLLLVLSLDIMHHSFSSTLGDESQFSLWASAYSQFCSLQWVIFMNCLTYCYLTHARPCIGFGYDRLTATPAAVKGFVVLYCFANFFQNFGPNTTTFVIPGEAFPTRYRSTAHGISAASGKLGAIVAQVGFARMVNIGGTNNFVKHMCVLSFPRTP